MSDTNDRQDDAEAAARTAQPASNIHDNISISDLVDGESLALASNESGPETWETPRGEIGPNSTAPAESALAAVAFVQNDDRKRQSVLDDLFKSMRGEASDANRCVMLAAAKVAYEQLHPETRQGGAPGRAGGGKAPVTKDPDSGSFVRRAVQATGWARTSIYRSLSVGERLSQSAYKKMLGTRLCNRIGELEQLVTLPVEQQLDIATDYSVGLERQARAKLRTYVANQEPEPDEEDGAGEEVDPVGGTPEEDAAAEYAASEQNAVVHLKIDGSTEVLRIGDHVLRLGVRKVKDDSVAIAYEVVPVSSQQVERPTASGDAPYVAVTNAMAMLQAIPDADRAQPLAKIRALFNGHEINEIVSEEDDDYILVRAWAAVLGEVSAQNSVRQ